MKKFLKIFLPVLIVAIIVTGCCVFIPRYLNKDDGIDSAIISAERELRLTLSKSTKYYTERILNCSVDSVVEEAEIISEDNTRSWTITAETMTNRGTLLTQLIVGEVDSTFADKVSSSLDNCIDNELIDNDQVVTYLNSVNEMVENSKNISFTNYSVDRDLETVLTKDDVYDFIFNYYLDSNINDELSMLVSDKASELNLSKENIDNLVHTTITLDAEGLWYVILNISLNNHDYFIYFNIKNNGYNNLECLEIVEDYILEGTTHENLTLVDLGLEQLSNSELVFNEIENIKTVDKT